MQCKSCSYPHSQVVKVLHDERKNTTIRRRECLRCSARFTTSETFKEPRKQAENGTLK
jgi:transcriptional regulator NrdR family protein